MKADIDPAVWCVGPEEPWYRAVLAKVDDHIADANYLVRNFQTAQQHGFIAHAAGQLEALSLLREEMERMRAEAMETSLQS